MNKNIPAFPVVEHDQCGNPIKEHKGMTLRDYFAIHASDNDVTFFYPKTMGEYNAHEKKYGKPATIQWARYAFADAMLTEREGGEG